MSKYQWLMFFLTLSVISLNAQNVGIGTTAPGFPLNFSNALGDKISLWGNAGNHYGFGIQSGLLQVHTEAVGSNIAFGYGSSSSFTERMQILNNGDYDGMSLYGRLVLKNGSNDLVGGGAGVWLYKANNTALLGFMGAQNNQNIGFYGGPGGWGFTYDALNSRVGIGNNNPNAPLAFAAALGKKITFYPGGLGDAGIGMASNRLQIYADNPNADVAIGYDAAGTFNERFAVKASGELAVSGNAGNAGQVLQSNGSGAAASWTGKPYVIYFNQTGFTGFDANNILSLPIAGLDGNSFTLQQNSRIVFHTTLHTGATELIATSRYYSDVQIINSAGVVVERATCWVLLSGGFEDTNANSTGIGILQPGTYTIRAFLKRPHSTDGQAWCDKGSIDPNGRSYRGGQMIIEVFPE